MTDGKNKLDELIINSPTLKRVGAPQGNQNARKAKNNDDDVNIKNRPPEKMPGGNSREYWIGRLKRDAPDHLELLANGEYKTVSEAARKAGLKKKSSPNAARMFKGVDELGISDLEHLVYLTKCRFSELEEQSLQYQIAKALHAKHSNKNKDILHVLRHSNQGPPLIYISRNKELYNFGRKFHRELRQIPLQKDSPVRKGFEVVDTMTMIMICFFENWHYYYEKNIRKSALPWISKIILPIWDDGEPQKSHIKCLEISQYTDDKKVSYLDISTIPSLGTSDMKIHDSLFILNKCSEVIQKAFATWPKEY